MAEKKPAPKAEKKSAYEEYQDSWRKPATSGEEKWCVEKHNPDIHHPGAKCKCPQCDPKVKGFKE